MAKERSRGEAMTWQRINIVVEGQTEEEFVNEILEPHLRQFELSVRARMIETCPGKSRIHKGGLVAFEHLRRDVSLWCREESGTDVRFTSMVDLYAYPKDSPNFEEARKLQPRDRVAKLEQGMADAVDDWRFIPYIQLHEFETLLLSDMSKWSSYFIERESALEELRNSVNAFTDIELINDGKDTAPSKRILHYLPEYDKVAAGVILADSIGLPKIRKTCTHFDEWLKKLEKH